ncbi:TetR/AcrR family transcriptional regulator [Rhodococcoides yunnanense]|uniref:TetR/AcrR family transcriptional regulator n=1 Tax=Rhodococcoides yunnanense TaxID=278209 RepID=A0ABU4BKL5_9NOCA|nr:TetR/AcrR family transcriptional regulator [Rhodococcus yunnanensis]MDV6264752.1 TetR/AcrR family transcriptional regulator [Rhodococcus yunnanensis]
MTRPDANPRRPRTDGLRNRERLLAVGREHLWDRGFKLSAAAVASDAGVGIGTLYRHFTTRDDLIEAVLARFLTDVENQLDAVEVVESGIDALQEYARRLTGMGGRGLGDIVLANPDRTPGLVARRQEIRRRGSSLIARAQQQGALRADFTLDDLHVFLCAVAGLRADKRVDDALVDRFVRDHLEGVR